MWRIIISRIGGAGYRTRSAGKKYKSAKWRRFRLLFRRTKLPMDLLLDGGLPLNPYLLGKLKRYLLERLAPRELKTPPLELFEFEGMLLV